MPNTFGFARIALAAAIGICGLLMACVPSRGDGDIACLSRTKAPIFYPSKPTTRASAMMQGPLQTRTGVVLNITIERVGQDNEAWGRILEILTDGPPRSLVGKALRIGLYECVQKPQPGQSGFVTGSLFNEDSEHPKFTPLPNYADQ
jgi:hypothetical protein